MRETSCVVRPELSCVEPVIIRLQGLNLAAQKSEDGAEQLNPESFGGK